MKLRLLNIILFLNIIYLQNASGQIKSERIRIEEIDRKNIIKINLLSPFMGTISLQHERILTKETSIQNGLYYFSGLVFNQQFSINGICYTSEYRYYLKDEAPKGIYLQPYFRVARFWNSDNRFVSKSSNFYGGAIGLVIGKQWIFYDKFCLDIYAGPLYTKIFFDDKKLNTRNLPPMFDGYWLRAGLTVGYYL